MHKPNQRVKVNLKSRKEIAVQVVKKNKQTKCSTGSNGTRTNVFQLVTFCFISCSPDMPCVIALTAKGGSVRAVSVHLINRRAPRNGVMLFLSQPLLNST